MSVWKVLIAPEFGADLREIHAYISGTLLESATAKSLTDRILRAVQSLSDLPLRFPLYEKEPWRGRGLRKMQVGNYLVFYLTDEKTTTVMALHVLYAGRDIARCLDEAKE